MNKTYLVIKADGTHQTLTNPDLHDFQTAVGGLVTPAYSSRFSDLALYANDEALLASDPQPNHFASFMVGSPIFGDVVIISAHTNEDGNTLPAWDDTPAGRASMEHIACIADRINTARKNWR